MTWKQLNPWKHLRVIGFFSLLIFSFFFIDTITTSHPAIQLQSNIAPTGNSVEINLQIDYSDPDTYTHLIQHPGAKEMLLHFSSLNLADGDTITVSSPDGSFAFTYPGGPSTSPPDPAFWTTGIAGDTLLVELNNQSGETSSSFGAAFDHYLYVFGDDMEELSFLPEAIMGIDDKADVECYSGSHPDHYANSSPVAKVYYVYSDESTQEDWVYIERCSAFRFSDGTVHDAGLLITPAHCVADSTELDDMVFRFNYEDTTCGDANVSKTYEDFGWESTAWVASSPYSGGEDYTLFRIADTYMDPYGYIKIDPRTPVLHEHIYIPQHPNTKLKELAIFDTENTDDGLCRIDEVLHDGTWHDPDINTAYYCDTEGGSSGSPVIATDGHRALAFHQGGGAINNGVRFDLIWDDLDDYIKPYKIEGLDGPTGTITNLDPLTFNWDLEPTADDYRFVIYDSDGFSLYIANDLDPATICVGDTCSYTPTYEWTSGIYDWMVLGQNVSGYGESSARPEFTIEVLPDTPILIEPNTTIAMVQPSYDWQELVNVTDYRLFVTHPVVGTLINEWIPVGGGDGEVECYSGTCDFTHPIHLRTGNHTWYVQARNHTGGSNWSDAMWFRVFNSVTPWYDIVVTSHTHREMLDEPQPDLTWDMVNNASWYKVYISDSVGKLYNQYHRAADICYGDSCTLDWATYSPLFHAPRGITDFPTGTWIHFYGMPVNVAGNGDWTGPVDFWITAP